jgi:probable phosphoglycerate mutase
VAIYLIRHGETASNAARVFQTPDTPLSPRGREQAARLAERLAGLGVAAVLASDLARAAETAERIAAATGAPLALEPLLAERSFGALRGRPYAEIGLDPFAADYVPPAGESWTEFHARVDAAWARVQAEAARAAGALAVVTHGLVCHSLVSRHLAFGAGVARLASGERPLGFGNTALTRIEGPPWTVQLLACTAHLDASASGIDPAPA